MKVSRKSSSKSGLKTIGTLKSLISDKLSHPRTRGSIELDRRLMLLAPQTAPAIFTASKFSLRNNWSCRCFAKAGGARFILAKEYSHYVMSLKSIRYAECCTLAPTESSSSLSL